MDNKFIRRWYTPYNITLNKELISEIVDALRSVRDKFLTKKKRIAPGPWKITRFIDQWEKIKPSYDDTPRRVRLLPHLEVRSIYNRERELLGYKYVPSFDDLSVLRIRAQSQESSTNNFSLLLNKAARLNIPPFLYNEFRMIIDGFDRSSVIPSGTPLPGIPGAEFWSSHLNRDSLYIEYYTTFNGASGSHPVTSFAYGIIVGFFTDDRYTRIIARTLSRELDVSVTEYRDNKLIESVVYNQYVDIMSDGDYFGKNSFSSEVNKVLLRIYYDRLIPINVSSILDYLYLKDGIPEKYKVDIDVEEAIFEIDGYLSYELRRNNYTDIINIFKDVSGFQLIASFDVKGIWKIVSASVGPIDIKIYYNSGFNKLPYIKGEVFDGTFDGKVTVYTTILQHVPNIVNVLPINPYDNHDEYTMMMDASGLPTDIFFAYYLFGQLVKESEYLTYRNNLRSLIDSSISRFSVVNVVDSIMRYI